MEMLTQIQISERTGFVPSKVHRIIKKHESSIQSVKITENIKQYNVDTLPEVLKNAMTKK